MEERFDDFENDIPPAVLGQPLSMNDSRLVRRLIEQAAAVPHGPRAVEGWREAYRMLADAAEPDLQTRANLVEQISRFHSQSIQDASELDHKNKVIAALEAQLQRERQYTGLAMVLFWLSVMLCVALIGAGMLR